MEYLVLFSVVFFIAVIVYTALNAHKVDE